MAKDAAKLLVEFGFTDLEAEIYLFLLGSSPTTGYRVAKGIRKPAANTYKALQTLATKGAILVEDGGVFLSPSYDVRILQGYVRGGGRLIAAREVRGEIDGRPPAPWRFAQRRGGCGKRTPLRPRWAGRRSVGQVAARQASIFSQASAALAT